ncbi:MAG: TatD family hydrolase [Candidatus Cloacimonetes bacterium]|jgi:TatD DNase family protein|nr:TatD family hydrolase [Candidatus Cloacimonadota bacterium]
MRIFETHAHLDFDDYNKDREQVIKNCIKAGVERIINIGIDAKTTQKGIELSNKYPQFKATAGYHPSTVHEFDEALLRKLIPNKHIVAIGEIGLDYYRMYNNKELQQQIFEAQVKLAIEFNLPIVIHDRDAHEDCYNILKKYSPKKVVFHCFSGDVTFAEKILNEDWYLSITGVVTYKNSNLSDVIKIIPKDKFFIETDSPYLTPIPYRGKRNSPEYLIYVIQKIAEILRIPPKVIAEQSFKNAEQFFLKP